MNANRGGNTTMHGVYVGNSGPKAPAGWLLGEMQQLLKSTFWEMA